MAQFISVKKQELLAMANAGQCVAGNIMFANDTGEVYFVCVGGGLYPLSSIVLTGNIAGEMGATGPVGPTGATGATGPAGPATPLAQQIALTVALG
jgi:hypothetical protein